MNRQPAHLDALARHAPRSVRFKGVVEQGGNQVKTYVIDAAGGGDVDRIFTSALQIALPALPAPGDDVLGLKAHGFALLTLHCGTLANWLLLNWWVGGSILRQKLFRSEIAAPLAFRDISELGLVACVWEFGVLDFERRAWEKTMMAADGPHPDLYLAEVLNGTV